MRHTVKTPTKPPAKDGANELVGLLDATKASQARNPSGVELRIGILLWPRFPLLSLAGLCDALRHAADIGDQSRQVRCTWTMLGVPDQAIQASCGVEIPVQQSLSSNHQFDYVAVIGGLLPFLGTVDRRYTGFLRDASAAGTPLIGICTGSFALAQAGLLQGKVACVHPFHVNDWKRMFPAQAFATNADYLFDGDRITCAGGISIIELATELIRRHCGPDRAAKVVHQMTVSQRSSTHVTRRHALGYASTENDKLRQAIMLMEKNITTPLEIAVIARLVETSSRQLERVFQAETGTSPSEFYRNSRLKYGRWLLTTSDSPVSAIAYECGFADASHFIRHFQQLYGVAPGRLRRAVQPKST